VQAASVDVRVGLSYTVVNATHGGQDVTLRFAFGREHVKYRRATIAGQERDVGNPTCLTDTGLIIAYRLAPEQSVRVAFSADVTFRLPDAELLASYIPASDLTLIVVNDHEASVRVSVDPMCRFDTRFDRSGKKKKYFSSGAVLPYEGFRLDFLPPETDRR
jgi:hypothetical protein